MFIRSIFTALACLTLASPSAYARPGRWGGGWDNPGWGAPGWEKPGISAPRSRSRAATRDRAGENRIQVNRFVGDDAAALGHGAIAVSSGTEGQDYVPQLSRAAFEAAVIDQLVQAGYDTAHPLPDGGQLADLKVTRIEVEPAEAKRDPVSGTAAMSVSNRGTAYGMALNVDLTKPLPPLVSTRLEARIRDRASGKVLWEGRAEVATREGDKGWSEQDIAARLAAALFDGFPTTSDAGAAGG